LIDAAKRAIGFRAHGAAIRHDPVRALDDHGEDLFATIVLRGHDLVQSVGRHGRAGGGGARLSITMLPLIVFVPPASDNTIAPLIWCCDAASECTVPPLVVTFALPLIVTTTPSTEMLPPESILILLAPHSSEM